MLTIEFYRWMGTAITMSTEPIGAEPLGTASTKTVRFVASTESVSTEPSAD